MALSRAKTVALLCFLLAVATFVIVHQSDFLNTKPKVKSVLLVNTPKPKVKGLLETPRRKVAETLDKAKPNARGLLINPKQHKAVVLDNKKLKTKVLLNRPEKKAAETLQKIKSKGKGLLNKVEPMMVVIQNKPTRKVTNVVNVPRPTMKVFSNPQTVKTTEILNSSTPTTKVTSVATTLRPTTKGIPIKQTSKMTGISNTPKPKIYKWFYSPEEKESKWKRCKRLISGEEKLSRTYIPRNDSDILDIYKPNEECAHVLRTRFAHPPVSKEEQQLPIAYSLTIYKGACLFERILQAIYMPHNVYCIHIDKKSPEAFFRAIQAMIRCLPNVFIAKNRSDVVWGHFSVVQAQLNCMEELLQSSVKWKYYISLIGQDFPLYENKQIVRALQRLNNSNNIESFPMPRGQQVRTKVAFELRNHSFFKTGKIKPPPPHNISIFKGSTHIVAIRGFVEFVLHSEIGKDFLEFLQDTFIPDETLYSSLQQHPMAPGGIHGKQPTWIPRALYWLLKKTRHVCQGTWVRALCWISIQDLSWAFGEEKKEKLFVHKIPFHFNDDLLDCILVARQGRKYGTALWKQEQSTKT